MKWLLPTDICVVTGGNNGLGRQILQEFARHGCQTVSLDIKETILPTNDGDESEVPDGEEAGVEVGEMLNSSKSSNAAGEVSGTSFEQSTEEALPVPENNEDSNGLADAENTVNADTVEEANLEPILTIECDVRKESDLENARKLILEKFGRPATVAVLNAGYRHPLHSIAESTFEDLQATIDVNLNGVLKCIRTFLPDFIDQKRGFFVIVASALGIVVPKGLSAYGASKAGLIGVSEGLAQELKDYDDLHSLLVCPGQLDSAMFSDIQTPSDFLAPVVSTEKLAKKIVKYVRKAKTSPLYAPIYVRYLPFMNVVPLPVARFLRRISGVDAVYDKASGQSARLACEASGEGGAEDAAVSVG